MKGKEGINVVYSADKNYGKYLGISMLSLFKTNKDELITVYILDNGITDKDRIKLLSMGNRFHKNIYFINIEEKVSQLKLNMGHRKISIASYARLFISSMLPKECNKCIYLDSDTIITEDIHKLWNMDIEYYYIAGVSDTVDPYFLKKIQLDKNEPYINAGVLLINLKKWREDKLEDKFLHVIELYHGNVPHHDQGTINYVCKGRKLVLPVKYNMTSNVYTFTSRTIKNIYYMDKFYEQEEINLARKHPVILHFTTGLVGRPWEEKCTHPKKEEYVSIAKQSPWRDVKLQKDSRKLSVKLYGYVYRYTPFYVSEFLYKCMSKVAHIRE